jgi:hypothetical protein
MDRRLGARRAVLDAVEKTKTLITLTVKVGSLAEE